MQALRDRNVCIPVHVDTEDNLADLFTKILSRSTFEGLRDRVMKPLPPELQVNSDAIVNLFYYWLS